jgi:hypothetical protein
MPARGTFAIVGIWEKWRFDRLGSRGVTKNNSSTDFRAKPLSALAEQK